MAERRVESLRSRVGDEGFLLSLLLLDDMITISMYEGNE